MANKRKDGVFALNGYWHYRARKVYKGRETTDNKSTKLAATPENKPLAEAKYNAYLAAQKNWDHPNANMTLGDIWNRYLERHLLKGKQGHQRDLLLRRQRDVLVKQQQTAHIFAAINIRDHDTLQNKYAAFLDDMTRGIERRRFATEKGKQRSKSASNAKDGSVTVTTINLVVGPWVRALNWCAAERDKLKRLVFPAGMLPTLALLPEDENEPVRKSASILVSEAQVRTMRKNAFEHRADRRTRDGDEWGPERLSKAEIALDLLYLTAQRQEAVALLPWANVHFGKDHRDSWIDFKNIHDLPVTDKRRKEQQPMTEMLYKILRRAHAERTGATVCGLTKEALAGRIKRLLAEIGIKGGTHLFRKAFPTHLYQKGVNADKIAHLMAVSVATLFKHYIQQGYDQDRQTVAEIDAALDIAFDEAPTVVALHARQKAGK